jgi:hypothetical protein
MSETTREKAYLIPIFCPAAIYHGWHLYLCDTNDGEQGKWDRWFRGGDLARQFEIPQLLSNLGHTDVPPYSRYEHNLEEWFAQHYPNGLAVWRDVHTKHLITEPYEETTT